MPIGPLPSNAPAINVTIFRLARDAVIRKFRMLHSEQLCGLCRSPDIIKVVKCKKMTSGRHVARIRKKEVGIYRISVKLAIHYELLPQDYPDKYVCTVKIVCSWHKVGRFSSEKDICRRLKFLRGGLTVRLST